MKLLDSTKLHRKSGGSPTIALVAEVSAITPFWESIGNRSLLSQVRWGEGHPALRLVSAQKFGKPGIHRERPAGLCCFIDA
jgi:hypothetical protein